MTGRVVNRAAACAVLALGLGAPGMASADTVTLNTSDSQFDAGVDNHGWWSATLPAHDDNENYFTGRNTTGADSRSFFTFDLSTLTEDIVSATLELAQYQYVSPDPSETLGLFDVGTDAAILNNNQGTSSAIFGDLGSGTSYGSFVVSAYPSSSDSTLSFTLNADGVAALNAARGGWFSVGAALTSLNHDAGYEAIFGASDGAGTQRLLLETEPAAAPVPLPAAAWGGMALMGLIGAKRMRRKRAEA